MSNQAAVHATRLRIRRRATAWLALPLAAGAIGIGAISLIGDDDDGTPAQAAPQPTGSVAGSGRVRYDGGPEEGSRGPAADGVPADGIRHDGGPEEGTRGPVA